MRSVRYVMVSLFAVGIPGQRSEVRCVGRVGKGVSGIGRGTGAHLVGLSLAVTLALFRRAGD